MSLYASFIRIPSCAAGPGAGVFLRWKTNSETSVTIRIADELNTAMVSVEMPGMPQIASDDSVACMVVSLRDEGGGGSAKCGKCGNSRRRQCMRCSAGRKAFPAHLELRRILLPDLATLAIATIVQVRERGHLRSIESHGDSDVPNLCSQHALSTRHLPHELSALLSRPF